FGSTPPSILLNHANAKGSAPSLSTLILKPSDPFDFNLRTQIISYFSRFKKIFLNLLAFYLRFHLRDHRLTCLRGRIIPSSLLGGNRRMNKAQLVDAVAKTTQ